eukprot:scaffold16586_cov33-Tisochrysis_lutea.AAC.4
MAILSSNYNDCWQLLAPWRAHVREMHPFTTGLSRDGLPFLRRHLCPFIDFVTEGYDVTCYAPPAFARALEVSARMR